MSIAHQFNRVSWHRPIESMIVTVEDMINTVEKMIPTVEKMIPTVESMYWYMREPEFNYKII